VANKVNSAKSGRLSAAAESAANGGSSTPLSLRAQHQCLHIDPTGGVEMTDNYMFVPLGKNTVMYSGLVEFTARLFQVFTGTAIWYVKSGRLEFYFTPSAYCSVDMDAPFNPRPGPGSKLLVSHANGRSPAPKLDGRRQKLMPRQSTPPPVIVAAAAALYSLPIDYDRWWAADGQYERLCTAADIHRLQGAMDAMYNVSVAATSNGGQVPRTWKQLVDSILATGIYKFAAAAGAAITPGYSTWELVHYLVAIVQLTMGTDCGAAYLRNSIAGSHGFDVLEYLVWGHFIAEIPPEHIVGTTTSQHWDRAVLGQDSKGQFIMRNETGVHLQFATRQEPL